MTLPVEPKIVLPGLGCVGIEDTAQVGPKGPELRTELLRAHDALRKSVALTVSA